MIQFDEHIFQMGWFNHQRSTKMAQEKSSIGPGPFRGTKWMGKDAIKEPPSPFGVPN